MIPQLNCTMVGGSYKQIVSAICKKYLLSEPTILLINITGIENTYNPFEFKITVTFSLTPGIKQLLRTP